MSRRGVLLLVLVILAGLGGWFYGPRWLKTGETLYREMPHWLASDDRLHRLPPFQFPTLEGWMLSSTAWRDRVVVLNFWATWCPPCRRELPLFVKAQDTYPELQVVGIAIDSPEAVREFIAQHPVNYPILLGDTQAIELARRLGDRLQGLPFTAIFDRDGELIYGRIGAMTATSLAAQLDPLFSVN